MIHKIYGHRCDRGYNGSARDYYHIEIREGRIYGVSPAIKGTEIYVRQLGDDAPLMSNGDWEFWPDPADLARIGIKPIRVKAPPAVNALWVGGNPPRRARR